MTRYDHLRARLAEERLPWLVTGAAGFIGSHLVETLLSLGQDVRALDDFSTGRLTNLDDVRARVGAEAWERFSLVEGTIADPETCARAVEGRRFVLHQAALGSVPRSIAEPVATHTANATGTLNLLVAARDAGAERFVYASSSSVYGDHPGLPKVEAEIGEPLSPYAASKLVCEVYAKTFQRVYGLETVGLRYFNVLGPRQDPDGPYAAVIPRWIRALLAGERATIHGDGTTSRDFCPVANVVQANLLAATAPSEATGRAYNVALGGRTSLTELFAALVLGLERLGHEVAHPEPHHGPFRDGDIRHSLADVSAARDLLGYEPAVSFEDGLQETITWFARSAQPAR